MDHQGPDTSTPGMAEGNAAGAPEETKQRCPLCPFACDSIDEINKHVALHQQQQQQAAAAAVVAAACGMCEGPKEVTLYGCGVCAKAFALKEELDEHMQSHASRLFSCAVCGAIFVDKDHLDGHMRTHEVFSYGGGPGAGGKPFVCSSSAVAAEDRSGRAKKRPFICPTCGKAFRRKEHVERHMKMHTGERNFVCSTCGKSFSQKVHLENHVRIHTGERPFSCHVCGKAFRRKEHIGRHMKIHTEAKLTTDAEGKMLVRVQKAPAVTAVPETTTHRCPLCPFATTSVNDFCKHVVLHAEGRSNCTVCDKKEGMEALEAPKAPLVVANPPSPQRCNVCGETFADGAGLQCHMRTHADTQLLWSCSFCGLVFSQKNQLDAHVQSHVVAERLPTATVATTVAAWPLKAGQDPSKPKERPYACPTCGKTFCQKAHLENHLRIHTGERPFSCTICGKAFRRKEHIGRHMRIHTGERPFCCPHCGKRFSQKVHLESHVRIHTGERPFSCSACGKTFTRKEHIERHIKTHTGERMFVCSSCGKSFNQKAHLESHMRTHTGERPFNCSPCGKTFRQKVQLDRHSRTHAPPLQQTQQLVIPCTEEQQQQRIPLCIPGCPTCGKTFCCHLEPQLNIRNLLGEAAQQQQQAQQQQAQQQQAQPTTQAPQQCAVQVEAVTKPM